MVGTRAGGGRTSNTPDPPPEEVKFHPQPHPGKKLQSWQVDVDLFTLIAFAHLMIIADGGACVGQHHEATELKASISKFEAG